MLLRYFSLAYALTWAFTIPFVIAWNTILDRELQPWAVIFLPGPYGPTIAALILTARRSGKAGVRALLARLLQWRAPIAWYAVALLLPLAVVFAAILISGYRSAILEIDVAAGLAVAPIAFLAAIPFGPLGEELGWRGFALPRLLDRGGPFKASLLLGIAWTFWHLPMFWFPGAAIPSFLEVGAASIALYALQIMAESCLLTAVFLATRGSVLLALIYHTSFNVAEVIAFRMLPEPTVASETQIYLISIALSWLIAIPLLIKVAAGDQLRKPYSSTQ